MRTGLRRKQRHSLPSGSKHIVILRPKGKTDNRRIASGSYDKTVQVWDATTTKVVNTYQNRINNVESVAWSPKRPLIASANDDKTVQIWQAFG